MSEPKLRPVAAGDLDELAVLHQRAFPASVLGRLGTDAVVRYYRSQLREEDVDAWVAVDGSRLLGYLVGGRFSGSMTRFVKDNASFLILQVVRRPALLVDRRSWRAMVEGARLALHHGRRKEAERPDRVPPSSFGVLAVAVDPRATRTGVGRCLLALAEDRARRSGYHRMHLTLDPANQGALAFYRRMGWQRLCLPGDSPSAWLMGKELTA